MNLLLCAALQLASASGARPLSMPYEERLLIMGTEARILVYAADDAAASTAARAAREELIACEAALSDYLAASELRTVVAEWSDWTPISDRLSSAINASRSVWEASDGAYDPTLLPVVELWRQARADGKAPAADALAAARGRVAFPSIQVESTPPARIRCARSDVTIDLGGVGKGLAAHRAAASARRAGATACLVALSGDIRAEAAPPEADGWRISVADGLGHDGEATLVLSDRSISTSGDAEQWAIVDGSRVSHLIDPATGRPLTVRRAATAVGRMGAVVDAAATAACVCGPERAASLVSVLDLDALRVRELGADGSPSETLVGGWASLRRHTHAP